MSSELAERLARLEQRVADLIPPVATLATKVDELLKVQAQHGAHLRLGAWVAGAVSAGAVTVFISLIQVWLR